MKQRTKKILLRTALGVAIGLVLLIGGAYLYFSYMTSEQSTAELESVADQFIPNESWELISENLHPPQRTCLDSECNTINRRWRVKNIFSSNDLKQLLENSGWHYAVEGDCDPAGGVPGSASVLCEANGNVDGYDVSVSVIGTPSAPNEIDVNLRVRGR